jgi:hypothetical protein
VVADYLAANGPVISRAAWTEVLPAALQYAQQRATVEQEKRLGVDYAIHFAPNPVIDPNVKKEAAITKGKEQKSLG